ncbi:tRNA synthetases class I (M)-domain-containing protein [Syncephalastrum racemosum]|uniref:methionine--tRNA ligase n=1 Tax=Syncephalastrum racemosum TaxID=13706 RepID=A0A1X2H8E8_SYNRA|nr:tRNA synthetases class I (M)-domain-containing protein [Syncephalastrum racemosum]
MVATISLTKLTPGTKPYINAFKLVLAGIVSDAKVNQQPGDLVSLIVNKDLLLTDANAAVKYLVGSGFDGSDAALKESAAIEKEEALVAPLVAQKKTSEALEAAEKVLAAQKKPADKLTAVDVIYFASLYDVLIASSDIAKYPTIAAWFKTLQENKNTAAALESIDQQISKAAKKKQLGAQDKKSAGSKANVLADLDPATQKLDEQVFMPKRGEEKVLPKDGHRNVLITSALPYVNNIPHLGNIIGSTLSADCFARYCRARGYNTLLICGTDEYGTATETKALEEGVSCQALCDKYSAIHEKVYDWFGLSFDHFGRTSTPEQTQISQDIFNKVHANGYTSENVMTQLFCEKCQRFLADRYVEGTCPLCNYEDARGDQCDACGKLLNATELVNPRCKLDGTAPITKDSRHLFLDLDRLQPDIDAFNARVNTEGKWSSNGVHITQSWLKEGLRPRCITRDLKWGTPVPLPGFESKVFYVWFDAPIGYPSITARYTADWEKWWKNPDNVKLYQFMGKDNVPFHSVIFPGTQIATKEAWTMVHHISTTEYLNYEGGKFSKSRNVGVFGTNAEETGIPPSVWRYYLLSSRPETSDSMFTWNEFITKNNSELLNNLGNFVNRVIKFAMAKYDGVVPEADLTGQSEADLTNDINKLLQEYIDNLENTKLRQGLAVAMAISARGNLYLQDSNVSNTLFTEQRSKCDAVVNMAVNLIYLLSALIYPYMPATSESISRQLNAPLRLIPDTFTFDIKGGHKMNGAAYLFSRIDEKMEEVWKSKYGSSGTK